MSYDPYDPRNAPDFYTVELRRELDVDGVLIVVYRDQDGDEFTMDADEYDGGQR